MQFIFDHLTATIVSAILLGVLMTINLRRQESAIDATRFHAVKAQQGALIDMLEYDLEDLGSGVPPGELMITAYDTDAFGVRTFEFRRELQQADGTAALASVRYTRVQDGTYTTEEGVVLPRFRILRFVEAEDGSMLSSTGEGYAVVSLEVHLLDADGTPVTTNINGAARVGVHLRNAFPFQDGDLQLTSWSGSYRPANLARRADAAGGVGF